MKEDDKYRLEDEEKVFFDRDIVDRPDDRAGRIRPSSSSNDKLIVS